MFDPGRCLREERQRLGLSIRALAALSGVAYPTISRLEQGHEDPRWSTIVKLYSALGLELESVPQHDVPSLTELSDAWERYADGDQYPDWTRLRSFADQLRRNPHRVAAVIGAEPAASGCDVLDALLAAMAEKLADDAGIMRPRWTSRRTALAEPWYGATRPATRAKHDACIPSQFRRRNLMIPASAIWRER